MSDPTRIPGFGWATASASRCLLHDDSVLVGNDLSEFPTNTPGNLVNKVRHDGYLEPVRFESAILNALNGYFATNETLMKDLEEFLATGLSNGRQLRWNLMKIAPNTSFRLHAHQNIELIYVIAGTMHEIRLSGAPPKRIFTLEEKEGPDLTDPSLALHFVHRSVSSAPEANDARCDKLEDYTTGFLINEKGSIHMSYTLEDGAELLVLWSGSHGNIPVEKFPPNAAEVFRLPPEVTPL